MPYEGALALTAKLHHEAKLAMIAKRAGQGPISNEVVLADVEALANLSKKMAGG